MIKCMYMCIILTTGLLKYNFNYCYILCTCVNIDLYYRSFLLRASRLTVKEIVESIHHIILYLTMLNTKFEHG